VRRPLLARARRLLDPEAVLPRRRPRRRGRRTRPRAGSAALRCRTAIPRLALAIAGARRLRAAAGAREQHDVHAGARRRSPRIVRKCCSSEGSVEPSAHPGWPASTARRSAYRATTVSRSTSPWSRRCIRDVACEVAVDLPDRRILVLVSSDGQHLAGSARRALRALERLRDPRPRRASRSTASWSESSSSRRAGALPLPPRRDRTGNERPRGHRAGSAPRPRQARGRGRRAACSGAPRRASSAQPRRGHLLARRVAGAKSAVARASRVGMT